MAQVRYGSGNHSHGAGNRSHGSGNHSHGLGNHSHGSGNHSHDVGNHSHGKKKGYGAFETAPEQDGQKAESRLTD